MKKSLLKLAFAAVIAVLAVPFAGSRAVAQTRNLTGTVVDKQGNPVIGAAVVVEGTTKGTSTGVDGSFSLDGVKENASLTVSFIGYKTLTTPPLGAKTSITITLEEDTQLLDDVVVIGYGVQRKSDVTGSITSIKEDVFQSRSVENAQQALQGKAPGVQVLSSSAAPGSSPSIRIRGFSSNNSGASEPLYVVDGLKVSDISYLDPSSIESMEILKDGASAAIYGVEAGNGVILITTKKGKKGEGRIFYDFTYGITSLARKADLMNAEQYVAYQTAAGNSQVLTPWDGKTDTDWFDVLYGDNGSFQRHTAGIETANDNGSVYASLSYMDNDGMYYGDKDWMKRITFQLNGDYKIKKWLTFTTNNTIESSRYQKQTDGVGTGNQAINPYGMDPLLPAFYDKDNLPAYMTELIAQQGDDLFMKNGNGDYVAVPFAAKDATSPLTHYYSNTGNHKDFALRGTSSLILTPVKGLTVTSRVGYRLESTNYSFYGEPTYMAVSSRTNLQLEGKTTMNRFYMWENFANYNRTFGKHAISAMVGMAYQYEWSNYTSGSTNGLTNDADNFHHLDYASADATKGVGGKVGESSSISYFGRVGYTFDDRYNIMVNFRADAFDRSKLDKKARWGYFPSVSAGWTISNEPFMRDIDPKSLSFLKLRASYGINGNIRTLSGFPYLSSMNVGEYYPMNGQLITTIYPSDVLANKDLKWETARQVDVGVDARFLNNRLTFGMDFYNKNTVDQLVILTPPLSTGTTSMAKNVGKVNNHGFEFELGWQDQAGEFSYGVNANLATINSEVKKLEGPRILDGIVAFDKGQPMWSYYGWKYLGVDKEDGSAIYYDKDDNGTIDDKDKVYLGSAIPDFTYGITLNAAYKGFDLTVFGSGSYGGELMLSAARNTPAANKPSVLWTESWDVMGAKAKYPHPDPIGDKYAGDSSMWLKSGSYFKIKQIQLGYTLPSSITKKIAISRLRVYVSLDNFFCISSYWGMDPEAVSATSAIGMDYGDYPTPKTLTFGANLSF
ncbi:MULTISPECIES: SusC/RagA family TonB-linked outer membrane protein [Alistipes]|uniref:SusC/RagA family TonB-linked outer membrane protein n=1 Tax=Alistipes TaxID=239759 RepID=UPI001B3A7B44|nr:MULTISPECIES: TonB-dependent receptor [Alistipes]MBQ4904059.1 TonB-dependent receptor [Alistipes sp. Marseille-P2263]MCI2259493.1 TonB-dependent receptor [Alistipes dispar]